MSVENISVVRQYSFESGPNYTDKLFTLDETELSESENVYFDGTLKIIPGAARLITTIFPGGGTPVITGLFQYEKKDGTQFNLAASDKGNVAYQSGTSWTTIASSLSTAASTRWDFEVFNNTLVALNGVDAVRKWFGSGSMTTLAGSPPTSKYAETHVDWLLFAGHTSNPSQVRYSDTATAETWPIGNVLNFGLDDGEIITGIRRFGDSTVVFKTGSIYLLNGDSPNDFAITPTVSEVGCVAPQSIVRTDLGLFFWSEAGPALFNGFKSILLGKRLRDILNEVDWDNTPKISSAFYPFRKQVVVSYPRTGQTYPDRMLILDLYRVSQQDRRPYVFWPVNFGASSMTTIEDSTSGFGRNRLLLGHSNGFVTKFDPSTPTVQFNGVTITPRVRTKVYTLGRPDMAIGVRDFEVRTGSTTGSLIVRYAVDGAQTFTTHTQSGVTMANSGYDFKRTRFEGNGSGQYIVGNTLQFEFSATGHQGFELLSFDSTVEKLSRRSG